MKDIKFRRITAKDKDLIKEIAEIHLKIPINWNKQHKINKKESEIVKKGLNESCKNRNAFFYIGEKNKQLISFIFAEIDRNQPNKLHMGSLWTHKNYRKLGIGKKMKKELEKWAKKKKVKKIDTKVNIKNKSMVNLNKKLKYKITSYIMEKKL